MENAKHTAGTGDDPFTIFYRMPTPTNAINLAIADHKAGKAESREFIAALDKAKHLLEAMPDLMGALRASVQALDVLSGKAPEKIKAIITANSITTGLPLGQAELEQARAAIAQATGE